MKTPEELNALKEEYTELNKKLAELTKDDLREVTGGIVIFDKSDKRCPFCGQVFKYNSFPSHLMKCNKRKC